MPQMKDYSEANFRIISASSAHKQLFKFEKLTKHYSTGFLYCLRGPLEVKEVIFDALSHELADKCTEYLV